VLSGICYYLWERRERQSADSAPRVVYILAWALMLVTLAGQLWISITTKFATIDAYASVIIMLNWYSVFHYALAAIIGLLLLGRVLQGRRAGHDYVVEAIGYWWYYTVIASLLMWIFGMLL
jgi:apolipoprotein N-acyltransferase